MRSCMNVDFTTHSKSATQAPTGGMKLLVGGFAHETNTFSSKPTTIADFKLPGCWAEGDSLFDSESGTNTEIGGCARLSQASHP